ncbi:MAG TPA: hypothetical protein VFJ16_08305 [Longimicrobium sp.]|nr:hypothetical protein [Longimicrobium sp.]
MTATRRERALLLKDWEVRAFMERRKTQFRRVVVPQPQWCYPGNATRSAVMHSGVDGPVATVGFGAACEQWRFGASPFGAPGDRLWVKEIWACTRELNGCSVKGMIAASDSIWYRASIPEFGATGILACHGQWRTPVSMPRCASRLTLEITGVRVERLQEISEAGARAEGITVLPLQDATDPSAWWESAPGLHQARTPQAAYLKLWDSFAPKGHGSSDNPWVWVTAVRLVEVGG